MVVPTTSLNNDSKFIFNHTIYFIFILEAVSAVMTVPSPLYNDALVLLFMNCKVIFSIYTVLNSRYIFTSITPYNMYLFLCGYH